MNNVLAVRLGSERMARLKSYAKQTGRKTADIIRDQIDTLTRSQDQGSAGSLSPTMWRLCGSVRGPRISATNENVRKSFKR